MKLRTTTRANGSPGIREHVWGWDAVAALSAILLSLGAAWVSINREQAVTQQKLESLVDTLPSTIEHVVRDIDRESGYVTRADFDNRDDQILRTLMQIEERQRQALGIMATIPMGRKK